MLSLREPFYSQLKMLSPSREVLRGVAVYYHCRAGLCICRTLCVSNLLLTLVTGTISLANAQPLQGFQRF